MNNVVIYFSGTGNTKILANEFAKRIQVDCYSIENGVNFSSIISACDVITICFPIHLSSCPMIMADFLLKYQEEFKGKDIISLATQQFFSGDGALSIRPYLEDVNIIYAKHFNMPSNIVDVPVYSTLTKGNIDKSIVKVRMQLDKVAEDIANNRLSICGKGKLSYQLGMIQRRSFIKYNNKRDIKVAISKECILCDKCVMCCPTKNLVNDKKQIINDSYCTLCYRCVNICPRNAISVFGKHKPYFKYYVIDKEI